MELAGPGVNRVVQVGITRLGMLEKVCEAGVNRFEHEKGWYRRTKRDDRCT